jgi:signal transduction histidine kinase
MEVARDAAVQANRAKSTFLANMSHELRTPLTAILGYAEIMQEDLKQSSRPQMLADVGHILGAGNHLLTVVNDLLDISKIEAGRMGVDARPFHVPDLLRDVQHTVMPLAERNRNELQFEINEDVGIATGDPIKLRQILANLLSNACKFTENGKVLLRCWRDQNGSGDQVYFAVSDTGIGISPDDLPRLFHEFSQLDSSFTRRYSGTGLGLVLCKRFAELMGGSISVESEPGKGSTFTLRIPAEAPSGSKPGSTKMVAQ